MCSSGCPTPGAHRSWGECVKAKNTQVGPCTLFTQYQTDKRELSAYYDARKQGIQPAGTRMYQIETAVKGANESGVGDPWQ